MALNFPDYFNQCQPSNNPNMPTATGIASLIKHKQIHYKLRDYQSSAIKSVNQLIDNGENNISIIAPTGAGKTVIGSFQMIDCLNRLNEHDQILFIVHLDTLVRQTFNSIFDILSSQIEFDNKNDLIPIRDTLSCVHPDYKYNPHSKIVVVSLQKLATSFSFYKTVLNPKFILFDECHTTRKCNTGQNIVEAFSSAVILGYTATPYYLDKKIYFGQHWEHAIVVAHHHQLIQQGSLTEIIYKSFIQESQTIDLELNSKGEFKVSHVKAKFDTPERIKEIVEYWQVESAFIEKNLGKEFTKTIVFPIDISHGKELRDAFIQKGYKFEIISSRHADKHNKYQLDKFKKGELDGILSVGMLNIGFDDPGATIAITTFVTQSLARYIQSVGRITRIKEGKKFALLMDFGGNVSRHGFLEDIQLTEDKVLSPKKFNEFDGEAPKKVCEECATMNAISAKTCFHCGHPFPEPEKPVYDIKGTIIQLLPVSSVVDTESAIKFYQCLRKKAYYQGYDPNKANLEYQSYVCSNDFPLPSDSTFEYDDWVQGAIFGKPKSKKSAKEFLDHMLELKHDHRTIKVALLDEFDSSIAQKLIKIIPADTHHAFVQFQQRKPKHLKAFTPNQEVDLEVADILKSLL